VRLAAARNEWESFQILVRSSTGVKGVRIEPGDLVGPDGRKLLAQDARLYRQHQLYLSKGTFRNANFRPGWYPDALIPFKHPITRQPLANARFTAVPFDLPPDETHGFWIDIYVPADAAAGDYVGKYQVAASDGRKREIPVTVHVWDFSLPRISTLRTAFGSPGYHLRLHYQRLAEKRRAVGPLDWPSIDRQCAEMLSRHRFNAVPPPGPEVPFARSDGTFHIPSEVISDFRQFVDQYHVNAFCIQHPRKVIRDPVAERDRLHAWLAAWDRAFEELDRPDVLLYTYLVDEPDDEEAYRYARRWGQAIREARTVVKVLVVEQSWPQDEQWGDLYGAVDIWCPLFPKFRAESAASRRTLGETIWTYTALCQLKPTPWWHIDYPLLNYRVPAWVAWRYRISGLLYWGGMCWWNEVDDPWTEPATYFLRESFRRLRYNGEGTLAYPGRDAGYDGIAPSLRLKSLRDAVEDYEYLSILEELGLADEAERLVCSLADSWTQWETDPAVYEMVRAKLAEMIVHTGAAREGTTDTVAALQ
jgi:hypothetical protein